MGGLDLKISVPQSYFIIITLVIISFFFIGKPKIDSVGDTVSGLIWIIIFYASGLVFYQIEKKETSSTKKSFLPSVKYGVLWGIILAVLIFLKDGIEKTIDLISYFLFFPLLIIIIGAYAHFYKDQINKMVKGKEAE
ncbi:MAG: hypothetical protein ABH950_09430 [Candidatus Altiarchaeota archaeon]